MEKNIYVLGIGFTTPVFIDLVLDCGYNIEGLFHYNEDRVGEIIHGYRIEGSFDDLFHKNIKGKYFLLTMGNMKIRKELSEKITALGGIIPTLIHPTALISRFAEISDRGVLIAPHCIIQADVKIAEGVVLRDDSMICHTTNVHPYTFIGPKALVGARICVGELSFIGQGAVVVSGKAHTIGRNAIIGAGAVVTKTILENQIVVGNPARSIG